MRITLALGYQEACCDAPHPRNHSYRAPSGYRQRREVMPHTLPPIYISDDYSFNVRIESTDVSTELPTLTPSLQFSRPNTPLIQIEIVVSHPELGGEPAVQLKSVSSRRRHTRYCFRRDYRPSGGKEIYENSRCCRWTGCVASRHCSPSRATREANVLPISFQKDNSVAVLSDMTPVAFPIIGCTPQRL